MTNSGAFRTTLLTRADRTTRDHVAQHLSGFNFWPYQLPRRAGRPGAASSTPDPATNVVVVAERRASPDIQDVWEISTMSKPYQASITSRRHVSIACSTETNPSRLSCLRASTSPELSSCAGGGETRSWHSASAPHVGTRSTHSEKRHSLSRARTLTWTRPLSGLMPSTVP
jgi:hypothetical protein